MISLIFMILLVAVIVLIDVSGSNLNEKITPLIYIASDEGEEGGADPIEFESGLTPEQLAARAQDKIFEGSGSEEAK